VTSHLVEHIARHAYARAITWATLGSTESELVGRDTAVAVESEVELAFAVCISFSNRFWVWSSSCRRRNGGRSK
jgi:hypothetical protein